MPALNDLGTAGQRQLGTMCFNTGLVAAGTSAGTIKTVTNTVPFAVDGIFGAKAPTDNIAIAAPSAAQMPNGYEQWALYSIGSAEAARTFYVVFAFAPNGDVVTFQGSYSGQSLVSRGGAVAKGDGLIPSIPSGFAPFAIAKIENPANLAFVPGTTALTTASGRTVTFKNVCALPAARTF